MTVTARLERLYDVSRDGRPTIAAMAGLRGFAVALVFLAHYVSNFEPWLNPGSHETMTLVGSRGVDLFFVLSGYLIYGALLRGTQPLGPFLWRRMMRIYPAFTCVFLLYVGLAFAFNQKLPPAAEDIAPYLVANYLLLPGMLDIPPLITVAWSLSYEACFYACAPVFVLGLGLRNRSAQFRVSAVVALTLVTAAVLITRFPDRGRMLMFTAGMVLLELQGRPWRWKWPAGILSVFGVAVLLPAIPETWRFAPWSLALVWAGFGTLCLDALHWRTLTTRILEWAPLRWLGNMSYSYYLLHGLTLKAGFTALRQVFPSIAAPELWFWVLLPAAFLMTLVPTTLLFVVVEKPFSFPARSPVGRSSTPMVAGV